MSPSTLAALDVVLVCSLAVVVAVLAALALIFALAPVVAARRDAAQTLDYLRAGCTRRDDFAARKPPYNCQCAAILGYSVPDEDCAR